jgi:hypothetical protein
MFVSLRPVTDALRFPALLHKADLVLALALALPAPGLLVLVLLTPVLVLLLPLLLVLLLQPASNTADITHAAVSPLLHLAIMPAACPVHRRRHITRIG